MKARSTLTFALALALTPAQALALDLVTYPYDGVMHLHRVVWGLDAHVVTVDLASGESEIVATAPRRGGMTVSRFARENDAQIAINANFYDAGVCGMAMGDGRVWDRAYREWCDATMAFGPTASGWRGVMFDSEAHLHDNPIAWATQAVTGWPVLLAGGEIVFDPHEPRGMYRVNPRTAIALTADHATLVLAVVDGRRFGSPGITSVDLIPLLEEFGAHDAINLDGGGSTTLFIEAEGGVVNHPCDGVQRGVMNHLGVRVTSARR